MANIPASSTVSSDRPDTTVTPAIQTLAQTATAFNHFPLRSSVATTASLMAINGIKTEGLTGNQGPINEAAMISSNSLGSTIAMSALDAKIRASPTRSIVNGEIVYLMSTLLYGVFKLHAALHVLGDVAVDQPGAGVAHLNQQFDGVALAD